MSVGGSQLRPGEQADERLSRADKNLYAAKTAGRYTTVLDEPDLRLPPRIFFQARSLMQRYSKPGTERSEATASHRDCLCAPYYWGNHVFKQSPV